MAERVFRNEPLTNMVAIGSVAARSARLWIRSERAGRLHVVWSESIHRAGGEEIGEIPAGNESDNTCVVRLQNLRPLTRYVFRVEHEDGTLIGSGELETAPAGDEDTPARFSIILMSCNQPFHSDGSLHKRSREMLRALGQRLREGDTKLVLLAGDQMYSDMPAELSLFEREHFRRVAPPGRERLLDCTVEEVRRLYQQRYRHFWNLPELARMQAEHTCYMIWDDHDIVDNWGSDPAHREPPWSTLGEGARRAAYDYQASRVLDPEAARDHFAYSVEYGCTAIHVMDLRSERLSGEDGRLYSPLQERRLAAFLDDHATKPVVFIVLSVPAVHLPKALTKTLSRITPAGEDFSDRWSSGEHIRDRDRFFHMLHEHQQRHPEQRVVLLSGDIHIGCAHEIRWSHGGVLHQFVSSGITHIVSKAVGVASKWLIKINRRLESDAEDLEAEVRLLHGEKNHHQNPYTDLNFGVVELERRGETLDVRLLLYGHDGDEPVCVYRSPPIRARVTDSMGELARRTDGDASG